MAATFESTNLESLPSFELRQTTAAVFPISNSFTWMLRVLCVVALSVTGYLAVTALRSEEVAGCGGGAVWDCGFALHSRWSKVFALPVSVPAFALYAVVLASLSFCQPTALRSCGRLAWGTVTVGAISAGLAAVWFIGLQVLAVGHLCVYCIAAHVCGLLLCLAILWKSPTGARTTARLSGLSALGVSMLIATQVFSAPPPTYKIEYYPTDGSTSKSPAAPALDSRANGQPKSRTSEVFEPPSGVPADIDEK